MTTKNEEVPDLCIPKGHATLNVFAPLGKPMRIVLNGEVILLNRDELETLSDFLREVLG